MSDPLLGPPIAEDHGFQAGQIAFVAAPTAIANEACAALNASYGTCPVEQAKVVVALGGEMAGHGKAHDAQTQKCCLHNQSIASTGGGAEPAKVGRRISQITTRTGRLI